MQQNTQESRIATASYPSWSNENDDDPPHRAVATPPPSEPKSPSNRHVTDPSLYARVILTMKRGEREVAVRVVQEGLEIDAEEAAAEVERLWRGYRSEISPTLFAPRPWYQIPSNIVGVVLTICAVAFVIWILLTQ